MTYLTLKEAFRYEIPKIKGSRFITTLIPAVTQEQLEADLEKISKEYYDATHNCYAWRFPSYAHQDLFGTWIISAKYQRANDDGEPANTA